MEISHTKRSTRIAMWIIAGLPMLQDAGIPAAAVGAMSARIGDGLSTYHDGVISALNALAHTRGVREGMRARDAAALMLGNE